MTSTATILAATRNAMVRIGFISSDAELTSYRCCCWSKWYGDFSVVQLKKTIPLEFLAKPKWNFIEQCSYAIWRPLIGKKNTQPLFECRSQMQFSTLIWTIFQLVVWFWHDSLIKAALTVAITREISKRPLIGAWHWLICFEGSKNVR